MMFGVSAMAVLGKRRWEAKARDRREGPGERRRVWTEGIVVHSIIFSSGFGDDRGAGGESTVTGLFKMDLTAGTEGKLSE